MNVPLRRHAVLVLLMRCLSLSGSCALVLGCGTPPDLEFPR